MSTLLEKLGQEEQKEKKIPSMAKGTLAGAGIGGAAGAGIGAYVGHRAHKAIGDLGALGKLLTREGGDLESKELSEISKTMLPGKGKLMALGALSHGIPAALLGTGVGAIVAALRRSHFRDKMQEKKGAVSTMSKTIKDGNGATEKHIRQVAGRKLEAGENRGKPLVKHAALKEFAKVAVASFRLGGRLMRGLEGRANAFSKLQDPVAKRALASHTMRQLERMKPAIKSRIPTGTPQAHALEKNLRERVSQHGSFLKAMKQSKP